MGFHLSDVMLIVANKAIMLSRGGLNWLKRGVNIYTETT
jgi:hypothetical protein